VHVDVVRTDLGFEIASGTRCDPTAVKIGGLPAIRSDGARVALMSLVGPANASDFDLDHDLVILDRRGEEQARLRLWTEAELGLVETRAACRAFVETIDARAEKARAIFTAKWRSLEPLPVHIDRVRDLEAPAKACEGWTPPVVRVPPDEAPLLASCNGTPRTLEVAVIGGPTLVVRVPGVKVWHRQPEPGLRMKVIDTWEPGMCSRTPVLDAGWRDAESGLVLVRVQGEDFGMDVCGYARQHRVIDPTTDEWPMLPWSRQPSPVDRQLADEELGGG